VSDCELTWRSIRLGVSWPRQADVSAAKALPGGGGCHMLRSSLQLIIHAAIGCHVPYNTCTMLETSDRQHVLPYPLIALTGAATTWAC
jgi:hypothetical protein